MVDSLPDLPPVTVVISTRNRGERVVETVQSILKNDYPRFSLLVIDQSADERTEKALKPLLSDSRFAYLRSETRGASVGLNLGIARAGTELIAHTDDDCVVPCNWLHQMVAALTCHPQIGLVFGRVVAGEYNPATGFIPIYNLTEPRLATSIRDKSRVWGIGACMGIRRSVWREIGGYDQALGPGTRFKSGADYDAHIKVLLAGYYIYETPDLLVVHNGFRNWSQTRELISRNWYGFGAILAKYLKIRCWAILPSGFYHIRQQAIRPLLVRLLRERRLKGFRPFLSMARGFLAGVLTPLDYSRKNYL